MAKTLQFRRGTTDQLSSVTGAEGELFVDLDKDVVVVMDGVTSGGHALQSELVSSTNIKTVNGNSLLGSGDIDLSTNLTLTNNNLEYTNIDGTVQTIDLSPYLDDTTNTIISGVLNGNEITFTREDSTTFTVDVTNLYDDTNLVTSVNGQTGEVVIDTTNWDTAYSWGDHAVEGYLKLNIDGEVLLSSDSAVKTTVTAVASITPTAIETFAIATYRSAKLQIQVTQGSNYQISDVIVIHDGTTASINENISLSTGSLICTFAAEITGGNLIVNTVMNTADAATVKVVSTKVTV